MNKFMIDILLKGIDDETRMKLLPREQEIIKDLKERDILYRTIREYFSYDRGKSLSMLREIMSVIERQSI